MAVGWKVLYDAAMEKQPGQFGIFALLVLTTAAALAFAVVRLPVPLILKLCVVLAIAICFYGWAVRNRKYPDPRQYANVPVSPARRRFGLAVSMLYPSIMVVMMIGKQVGWSARPSALPDYLAWSLILMFVAILAIGVWNLIRNW